MESLCSFQTVVIITLACSGIFNGVQKLSLSFILQEIPYRCVAVEENKALSAMNISVVDSCDIVMLNTTVPCTSWEYEMEKVAGEKGTGVGVFSPIGEAGVEI